MKILDLENKLEDLENDLYVACETANALQMLLGEGAITTDQADAILWGIRDNISDSHENVKRLVEETMTIRKILESI